ncbi:TauD/TfdA family dioxygenase [Myxococcus landrumensis]|uniref:TauD/TfdA family dioxygenase n=1 Tax=Myxococcus landrumensis TaxID=2813577 RepID=A0ABX7NFE4_9BACT|nr:TauD/TfdA family dioxygenase [Myxococcus landrumus]QSQ17128.1 TauD/TfdA family dioxygenase [Myxococcus landrumus]
MTLEPGVLSDVSQRALPGAPSCLLVVSPEREGADLVEWGRAHAPALRHLLSARPAMLFRGFRVPGVDAFERFAECIQPTLAEYLERSTPRTEVSGKVYTSTEYPAHETIPQHNEMSYASAWPMKLFFHCVQPSQEGGATPIADSRSVLEWLSPEVRERFTQRRVMYVRNYGTGVDLPWQKVFQTEDRTQVDEYCQRVGMQVEWLGGNRLRTRSVRPAVTKHPLTGEDVWFNQAHLFHVSNLGPKVSAAMRSVFKEEDLPRNSLYGDGSPISDADLEEVREAFRKTTYAFPWQAGDVMMLDNMLVTHGRTPFSGARRVVVAMGEMRSERDS